MSTRPRAAHGSTLLLVVILLAVLAAVGAAAVTLSSRDRVNASAKARRDLVAACASAAQVKIWAELAQYGPRWLGSDNPISELTLPDGTKLAPVHYDQGLSGVVAKNVVLTLAAEFGDEQVVDLTNRSTSLIGAGRAYRCVARCTVPGGFGPKRELEVEFQIRTRM